MTPLGLSFLEGRKINVNNAKKNIFWLLNLTENCFAIAFNFFQIEALQFRDKDKQTYKYSYVSNSRVVNHKRRCETKFSNENQYCAFFINRAKGRPQFTT